MCGIAGYFSKKEVLYSPEQVLKLMGEAIVTRGPDSHGEWVNNDKSVGFSHRRLAIVDLTEAGVQPMTSSCGRYVIVFNGEIYNHLDLRNQLGSQKINVDWRGRSDTETLLEGFKHWGVIETISKAVGMFSIAVLDQSVKKITLIRDRVGEKPLYYGWQNDTFLFASELKAIKVHPDFNGVVDRNALKLLLKYNYIPTPYSIYQKINKLLPGHYLELDLNNSKSKIEKYCTVSDLIDAGQQNVYQSNESSAVKKLDKVLRFAIKQQMEADVPLGAFLSGGVDSSLIVALMQAQSEVPIKTFSIGFESEEFNEAKYAKDVADYIGTEHTEKYVTAQEVLDVVPKLGEIFDEPFADSSQIPTFLVSQMAKEHVSVTLSGDAGDEVFCGYNRYIVTGAIWSKLSKVPVFIRNIIAKLILLIPMKTWDVLGKVLPRKFKLARFGEKIYKAANVMTSPTAEILYDKLVSQWEHPDVAVLCEGRAMDLASCNRNTSALECEISKMMAMDSMSYLPDDILVKVDRAAMAVSLEARVPFLDHNVIEFAWSLPMKFKLKKGISKWILREVLYKYVPKKLIDRPKMGFGVPLASWLRGPLKLWAEELINEERLTLEGYFNPVPITAMWNEHQNGTRDWHNQLWSVLMFQQWHEKNIASSSS